MKKKMIWYRIFKFVLSPIFRLYYHPRIINASVIPKEGPVIIAGNHKHLYDQCAAIIATKRPIHYMAKKEYFDGSMAWFFRAVGCIPVDRTKKDENATNSALAVLNQGGVIGIFPEGTRNKTKAHLLPFKYGAVSMAKKTNATIVPFGLTGDYRFRSKNLTIRFGKPFQVLDLSLEEANQKLYDTVGNLMDANLEEENRKKQ